MTTDEAPLFTAQEVADRLRVTVRTVQRLETEGTLIPVRVGRAVRYRREDVDEFLAQGRASA